MSAGDLIEMEGVVLRMLGGGQCLVQINDSETIVRARLSGRMKQNHIRVIPGDAVIVAVSPYDTSHGLIVSRQ